MTTSPQDSVTLLPPAAGQYVDAAKSTSMPLVSVVTPFYNTVDYLAACIRSVLGQTYPNFEYLLVNNCSTDGSLEVAERFAAVDKRIRLITNSHHLPQLPNYNAALARYHRTASTARSFRPTTRSNPFAWKKWSTRLSRAPGLVWLEARRCTALRRAFGAKNFNAVCFREKRRHVSDCWDFLRCSTEILRQ